MTGTLATLVVTTLACVLALAALGKLRKPRGRRTLAVGELAVAAACLAIPASVAGAVLAAVFAAFAIGHVRRRDAADPDCGCFGDRDPDPDLEQRYERTAGRSPVRAAWLTGTSAVLAALAGAVTLASPLRSGQAGHPGHRSGLLGLAGTHAELAAVVGGSAVILALAWRAWFVGSAVHPGTLSDRLVTSSALLIERRFSRRSMLVSLATAGSALVVAPLRYLLYPGTALAAISPGECAGGSCTDGYTAFCCEIEHGANTCPEGTFPGGWWMCTDYSGRQLCADEGVRYYVDCNALPGQPFPGGCRCANGTCADRRVACNIFRYGQCNTHIAGVTAVVCRMVVCENPSRISALNCSSALAIDDAVCAHEAPCLHRPARQLVGAGGV